MRSSPARVAPNLVNTWKTNKLTRQAMLCAAVAMAHQVAGKATRDALFLSAFPVSDLPRMVIGGAVASLALGWLFSLLLRRFGPRLVVPAGFVLSAAVQAVAVGVAAQRVISAVHSAVGVAKAWHADKLGGDVVPVPPVLPVQTGAVGVAAQRAIRAVHSAVGVARALQADKLGGVVPPVPSVQIGAVGVAVQAAMMVAHSAVGVAIALHAE